MKINWNEFQERAAAMEERQQNGNGSKVSFFTLKNDGDEAVVRIMHDSPEDFDMLAVHQTTIDGRFRNVSCLRSPTDPMDMCPFCSEGKKVNLRLYLHMIQYVKDENGQVVAKPVVWERSTAYARTVAQYIAEYGPLSDMIFKIKRNGAKGSMDTTYTIIPANAKLYPEDIYVKDYSMFDGYQALGHAVLDKNYEQMMQLLDGAPTTPVQPVAAPKTYQQTTYTAPQRPTYDSVVTPKPAATATPAYDAPQPEMRTYREPTAPATPASRPAYNAPSTGGNAPARPERRSYF